MRRSPVAPQVVGRPKQARSQQTLERLLDAAERLISERGIASVSVADVVEAARSSVGSFYGRFRDKDEMLRVLHRRRLSAVREAIERAADAESAEATPLRERVETVMTHLVAYYAADRRLIAAFVAHAASDPAGWAEAIAFHRDVARALARLVAPGPDGFDASSAGRAAELAVHVVLAFLDHDVLYGDTPGVASPFGGEELAEQLTRMVVAYLRGEAGDA